MNYEQFCKLIERTIGEFLPEELRECETSLHYADKANNVKRVGITFQQLGENTSPTIYLEDYYQHFINGDSFEDICVKIVETYEKCIEKGLDTSFLEGFKLENLKDKITMRMMNFKDNRMFLREVPHKLVDDLAVYYVVTIHTDRESLATMLIRDAHLEELGISCDELHEIAYKNTREVYPPELRSMREKLKELKETDALPVKRNPSDELYVLTNKVGQYGAVNILYPDIAEKAREIIGGDYYIIPSSVHECLLISKDCGPSAKNIGEMIREINMKQVEREEWLSDHAYDMDFDKKELRTVRESLPRKKEMER